MSTTIDIGMTDNDASTDVQRTSLPLEDYEALQTRANALSILVAQLESSGLRALLDQNTADWAPFLRFATPGHFYSPIPSMTEAVAGFERSVTNAAQMAGIDLNEARQLELFSTLAAFAHDWPFPQEQTPGFRYWSGEGNSAYGIGDAMMLHSMLRRFRPKRLIEVGSGFSSAMTLDTSERYLKSSVQLTFVEPYPALLHSLIGEQAQVQPPPVILETGLQDVEISTFEQLEAGDFLFVDSTHVARIGSDVNDLFVRILPALVPGVIIHVHDILWPFEYPLNWIEQGRAWNEAYLLHAFLQYNDSFEILLWNHWLSNHHRDKIEQELPAMLENTGGSIWLRRVR